MADKKIRELAQLSAAGLGCWHWTSPVLVRPVLASRMFARPVLAAVGVSWLGLALLIASDAPYSYAQITIAAPQTATPQYVDNPHVMSSSESVAPTSQSSDSTTASPSQCLPAWDPAWRGIDRHSVLTDADCDWATPHAEPFFDSPRLTHSHSVSGPASTPAARPRPALERRSRSSDGQLHQAYSDSYRSQLPSLKTLHPNDRDDVDSLPGSDLHADDCEPDLFGTHPRHGKTTPPFGSRGQWFGRYEAMVAWPYYSNGHHGVSIQSGATTIAEPFDYNLLIGNRTVVGWESKKGPGGMMQYTDLFAISEQLSAAAIGAVSGITSEIAVPGSATPYTLVANPGERIESSAREHLTSYRPTAFKRVYFPISTISGGFGLDYTVLRQEVNYSRFAGLAATMPNGTLDGRRRFSGIGPSFDIEYHRPIGHTQLAMLGGAQMGVLFGSDRWNVFENGSHSYQENSHRVITNANVRLGVEWSHAVGSRPDSRIFARFTIEGQNWLNAGNFSSPDASLGFLSGNFAFGAAY